jgi:hypothetical protein
MPKEAINGPEPPHPQKIYNVSSLDRAACQDRKTRKVDATAAKEDA